MGDQLMDAYVELSKAQKAKGFGLENLNDPAPAPSAMGSLWIFLAWKMLPKLAAPRGTRT